MPRIVPSQIVEAVELLFGNQNETDATTIRHWHQAEVRTLLALLDQLPGDLIDLPLRDYLEYEQCRSVLATSLPSWNLGNTQPSRAVGGKNPVERIRRLMKLCHDQPPPSETEFSFITDDDIRFGIEDRIRAAWIDFNAKEWIGATTSTAVALETILLWEVKRLEVSCQSLPNNPFRGKTPDHMVLDDLIKVARVCNSISEDAAKHAHLARDARNLIHPGKVIRSGHSCNKSTALATFAAVYRVTDELRRGLVRPDAL